MSSLLLFFFFLLAILHLAFVVVALNDFHILYCPQDTFDEGNSIALSYISYIGGSLSILACVVVVVVFEYFRSWMIDKTVDFWTYAL